MQTEQPEKGIKTDNVADKSHTIVSTVLDDGTIVETVLRGDRTELAVFNRGEWKVVPELKRLSGEVYRPLPASNSLIAHRAVLLPTGPEEYGDTDTLIATVKTYIDKYVVLSDDALELVTSYVLLTWVHESFEEVPYLRFLGDLGSGKTRALKVVGSIMNKPFFASAASTISPIFYALDQFSPTLILDEADMRYSDTASEFVKIFNNGTTKGIPVLRQSVSNKQGNFEPRAFKVFGPKIVAMRRRFQDDGLESRFLTEEMGRGTVSTHVPISLPPEQGEEARNLRNQLLMYRVRNLKQVSVDEEAVQQGMSGRFNQMLLPLLAVTDNTKGREAITRLATKCEQRLQSIREESLESMTVAAYEQLVETNLEKIPLSTVADKVRAELGISARPITNRMVAAILRDRLNVSTWKSNGVVVCMSTA